jgi:hypothetical protein
MEKLVALSFVAAIVVFAGVYVAAALRAAKCRIPNGSEQGSSFPSPSAQFSKPVELAWDADPDIVYVIKAHRLREATPVVHAGAIRIWGKLPWAWPPDGRRETLEGAYAATKIATLSLRRQKQCCWPTCPAFVKMKESAN